MNRSYLESKIKEARLLVASILPEEALPGACLYHAVALNKVLGAQIVAGSYSWQFTTKDNGKNPTHFSCIFDQRAQQQAQELLANPEQLHQTHLPEMHVWNYYQGKMLDITTRYVPQFAQQCGFFFEDQLRPPPYFWADPVHKSKRWLYIPSPVGTQLARFTARFVLEKMSKGVVAI